MIFISLFEINKENPFPHLTAPVPLIFLSNLFIEFEAKLHTNAGKLSLAKGIAKFSSNLLPKLPNQEPKDPPDWVILDIWLLPSFISVEILLVKSFFILVVCVIVRNKSCGNSSSSKFSFI